MAGLCRQSSMWMGKHLPLLRGARREKQTIATAVIVGIKALRPLSDVDNVERYRRALAARRR